MTRVLIVDTSYLLELFGVPRFSSPKRSAAIKTLFRDAIDNRDRIFVPLPCIYEFGNHLVDVQNVAQRRRLVVKFVDTVISSIHERNPWIITPAQGVEMLPDICTDFLNNHAHDGVGLTDCCTVHEANRLKRTYNDTDNYRVHIWTTDNALKAREPDREQDAFLG